MRDGFSVKYTDKEYMFREIDKPPLSYIYFSKSVFIHTCTSIHKHLPLVLLPISTFNLKAIGGNNL